MSREDLGLPKTSGRQASASELARCASRSSRPRNFALRYCEASLLRNPSSAEVVAEIKLGQTL
jgi:hypothetical protein